MGGQPSVGLPKPKSARPKPGVKSTASYASAAAPPSSDFDWDDDELETRLFEDDDKGRPADERDAEDALSSVPTKVDLGAAKPSVIPAPGLGAIKTEPGPEGADLATQKGATVVPGQMMAPLPAPPGALPRPGPVPNPIPNPALAQVPNPVPNPVPSPVPNPMAGPAPMQTAAMGAGAPMAMQAPPPMGMAPMAPGFGSSAPSMMPAHASFPGAPVMATAGAPGMMPSGAAAMPPGMGFEYDDRPRKSNVGPIVIIVLALLVLFGAAFGGIYVMLKDRNEGAAKGSATTNAPAVEDASGPTATPPGALAIQVTPADATVSVDGKPLAGASPFVTSVAPGKHKIEITHGAHLDYVTEVDVPEAGLSLPPIVLAPKAVKLLLELVPLDAQASVVSGGQPVGTGKNGEQLPVVRSKPDMAYEIQVSAPGYTSITQPIVFTGEAIQTVKVTLPKAAGTEPPPDPTPATNGGGSSRPKPKPKPKPKAKTATLRFAPKAGVPPAKVYVDGSLVGTTPIPNYKVTPGKHTIKFTWASGRAPKSETVTVGDNEIKTIKAG
ncbi:MAG: PEGA domain-containing protein [Myxococcales bacterium]|nr:PEGA domain-containing protein [Myxococcales bacterium]